MTTTETTQINQVPESVKIYIRSTIDRLKKIQIAINGAKTADNMFHGFGRYEYDAFLTHQTEIESLTKQINNFIDLADQNYLDGNAILTEMGFNETLIPVMSSQAQEWATDSQAIN